jgi:hypothetical protein
LYKILVTEVPHHLAVFTSQNILMIYISSTRNGFCQRQRRMIWMMRSPNMMVCMKIIYLVQHDRVMSCLFNRYTLSAHTCTSASGITFGYFNVYVDLCL